MSISYSTGRVLLVGGNASGAETAGVWARDTDYGDFSRSEFYSFRAAGYAS